MDPTEQTAYVKLDATGTTETFEKVALMKLIAQGNKEISRRAFTSEDDFLSQVNRA